MRLRPAVVRGFTQLLIFVVAVLQTGDGSAADAAWLRYENPHFIAYSNAPEKKAAALLSELETFRAAFLQIGNIPIPPDAPKTAVLIPATKKEFHKLVSGRQVAGFADRDGKRTLIVIPAQGDMGWAMTVTRHEYGHALLRYKRYDYPAWYEEGFAELVSSTKLVNKGKSFAFGMPPNRAKYNGPPLFDWDTLVSDEFDPHTLTDVRIGSSAYAQAWLLAHYTTLGNELKNAALLQKYFEALENGEAMASAFKSAFGMSAAELWTRELKDYTQHIPAYTIPWRPGALQLQFSTAPVSGSELTTLLRYMELRAALVKDSGGPGNMPALLAGRWAPLEMQLACENSADFAVDGAADDGTLIITPAAQPVEGTVEPLRYRYESGGDGLILLRPTDAETDPSEILGIHPRSADLLCMGPDQQADSECTGALYRCGS